MALYIHTLLLLSPYQIDTVTIRSDNGSDISRAIIFRSVNFSPRVESWCNNAISQPARYRFIVDACGNDDLDSSAGGRSTLPYNPYIPHRRAFPVANHPITVPSPFHSPGFLDYPVDGVCSIFLRVDRSINEIHNLRALFSTKIFLKKYIFINYWHLLCSHLFYKVGQFL
jgi:hypothetical protein